MAILLPGCGKKQSSESGKFKSARAAERAERRKERKTQDHLDLFSEMKPAELREQYQYHLERDNKRLALKYLERLVQVTTDHSTRRELLVAYGELLFDAGNYTTASKIFAEYLMLYPGDEQVERALYQTIRCSFRQMRSADRDQSITQNTIDRAKQFLSRSEIFTTYQKEVEEILSTCYQRLFDHEANVLHQKLIQPTEASLTAAQMRLDYLTSEIAPHIQDDTAPMIAMLEQDLADAHAGNSPQQWFNFLRSTLDTRITPTNTELVEEQEELAKLDGKKKNYRDRF